MKCYIIEQGFYSDYRVVGIFSTRENAEKMLAFINSTEQWDDPEITERDFDPGISELNEGMNQYLVRFTATSTDVERTYGLNNEDHQWNAGACYYCWAKDDNHAIKIASERHLQYEARKAGIA